MDNPLISPSILAADFRSLEDAIRLINKSEADWIHCDVMDGNFVPNISFGFPVLEAVKKVSEKPMDVHLMIRDPERYIIAFREAGASVLTVHYEACTHLHRTLQAIRDEGMRAGVAVNPSTPVGYLEEILPYTDLILVMSVNPGYGGQSFIETSVEKVRKLRELCIDLGLSPLVEVDGGINTENALSLVAAGANVLVAGSSVFQSKDPLRYITQLKRTGGNTIRV